jgi:hypothetical protein
MMTAPAPPATYPRQGPQPNAQIEYTDYPGYPPAVSSPEVNVDTHLDDLGASSWTIPTIVVGITSYIDQTVGGSTGTVIRNGYSTGFNRYWHAMPFRGQKVNGVMRDLRSDTGPVGRNNHLGILQAGVQWQNTVGPTLEEIYQSFVSR